MIDALERLREAGWRVAVHNDYAKGGRSFTFWLFTHPCGIWAKGEGLTDQLALDAAVKDAMARAEHYDQGQALP